MVGLHAAYRRDGWFDQVTRFASLVGFSVPTYFLGLLMLLVFFYVLERRRVWAGCHIYSASPFVVGSYVISRLLAENPMSPARQPRNLCCRCSASLNLRRPDQANARPRPEALEGTTFVTAGRVHAATLIRRMVLRNCLAPIVTYVGIELVSLMGTTAIIEYVFSWGGLGQYGLSAIMAGDFNAVQGYVVSLACFCVMIFLVVDMIVLLIEPRARA
jgi:peptide/nickel transport system permease protein